MNSITIKNLGITFEVGQEYTHPKWGQYTVLSINGEKMKVRFADGEKELTISFAARALFNLKCEAAKALKSNSIKGTGKEVDIAYTIGRIAVLGRLYCCGMRDREFDAFKIRYEKAGNKIDKIENMTILCDDANKWGIELSIDLPEGFIDCERFALPEKTGYVKSKEKYTINNNSFWWHLVEKLGFVLGNTQDIEKIAKNFPTKELENAFREGIK